MTIKSVFKIAKIENQISKVLYVFRLQSNLHGNFYHHCELKVFCFHRIHEGIKHPIIPYNQEQIFCADEGYFVVEIQI